MAKDISGNDFDEKVLQNKKIVLVDFWAPWCGPCQSFLPIIDELAAEISDAEIFKINVDENSELAQKFGVMSIPAIKIFKNGKMVDEATGVQTKEKLIAMIDAQK